MQPEIIRFYSDKQAYFEFSNFARYSVEFCGITYPTSEHAFQASKFIGTPRGNEYAEIIRSRLSPAKIKILARQKRVGGYKWKTDLNPTIEAYQDVKIRSDWDDVRDNIMLQIVYAKFSQHNELRQLLLDTGNATLIEASPTDYYWGEGKDGTGQNKLGSILQQVRELLRS